MKKQTLRMGVGGPVWVAVKRRHLTLFMFCLASINYQHRRGDTMTFTPKEDAKFLTEHEALDAAPYVGCSKRKRAVPQYARFVKTSVDAFGGNDQLSAVTVFSAVGCAWFHV